MNCLPLEILTVHPIKALGSGLVAVGLTLGSGSCILTLNVLPAAIQTYSSPYWDFPATGRRLLRLAPTGIRINVCQRFGPAPPFDGLSTCTLRPRNRPWKAMRFRQVLSGSPTESPGY